MPLHKMSVGRPHAVEPRDWSIRYALPGHGDAGPDCGEWRFWGHRLELGATETHWRRAKRSCGRFDCPICALSENGWAAREARSISERVSAGCVVARKRPIHVVVSPPPTAALDSLFLYRRLRHAAYRVARDSGFRGGCAVFHDRRLGSARFNEGRWLGCRKGPHFHLIGDGWIRPGRDGWVVKNLGVRKSVRGTAFYILSHAAQGILPMPDLRPPEVVTWFGSMAYNCLKVPEETPSGVFCAVCEEDIPLAEWFGLIWEGSGPPPGEGSGVCKENEWSRTAREWDLDEIRAWDIGGGRYPRKHTTVRGVADTA